MSTQALTFRLGHHPSPTLPIKGRVEEEILFTSPFHVGGREGVSSNFVAPDLIRGHFSEVPARGRDGRNISSFSGLTREPIVSSAAAWVLGSRPSAGPRMTKLGHFAPTLPTRGRDGRISFFRHHPVHPGDPVARSHARRRLFRAADAAHWIDRMKRAMTESVIGEVPALAGTAEKLSLPHGRARPGHPAEVATRGEAACVTGTSPVRREIQVEAPRP